jgi:hypothetical protein
MEVEVVGLVTQVLPCLEAEVVVQDLILQVLLAQLQLRALEALELPLQMRDSTELQEEMVVRVPILLELPHLQLQDFLWHM